MIEKLASPLSQARSLSLRPPGLRGSRLAARRDSWSRTDDPASAGSFEEDRTTAMGAVVTAQVWTGLCVAMLWAVSDAY